MPEAKVIGTTPANAGGILFATPASETAANVKTRYAESFEHLYAIILSSRTYSMHTGYSTPAAL